MPQEKGTVASVDYQLKMDKFWKWLIWGSRKGPRGIYNVVNWYLACHMVLAMLATLLINSDPFAFAQKALFPACSILIGLSMAWTARSAAILQNRELRDNLFSEERPAEDYVYGFQLAILVVTIMIVYVAIMAGGGIRISVFGERRDAVISGFWMYLLLSLTLRECWGVVNATNMLSMLEYLRTK